MTDLRDWMEGRRPPPPPPLARRLEPHLDHGGGLTAEALAGRGLEALERALACGPRDREAAFHLLAADALLTYACEAAGEAPDGVAEALERILALLGADRR